jgi:hypothetical protein
MVFGCLWERWRGLGFCDYCVDCAGDNRTAPSPAGGIGTHHHLPSSMAEANCEDVWTTSDARGIGGGGVLSGSV